MLALEEIKFLLESSSLRDRAIFSEVVKSLEQHSTTYLHIITSKNPALSSKLIEHLAILRSSVDRIINSRDSLVIHEILSIIEQVKTKRGQGWILELMITSGYTIDDAGACNGITEMASRAFLRGEIDTFDSRLDKIKEIPLEDFRVETDEHGQVKNTLFDVEKKKQEYLEKGQIEHAKKLQENLIDIMCFFDAVTLYQAPERQDSQLFESPIYTQDSSKVKPLLSTKIDDTVRIKAFFGAYTKDELTKYLDLLKEHIGRCSFSLKLSCNAHAINLNYNHTTDRWLLIDPSDLPGKEYIHSSILAQALLASYSQEHDLILHTVMDTTKANEEQACISLAELEKTEAWKSLHELSTKKINKSAHYGYDQFHYAAQINDFEWIESALKFHHSPALIGNRLLRMACVSGQKELIEFLITKQIASPDYEMLKEAYFSKQKYATVIKLLVDNATIPMIEDAYLNRRQGETGKEIQSLISQTHPFQGSSRLIMHAARKGDVELVLDLIRLGIEIDQPDLNDSGVTPLWWASKEGHAEIVAALLEAGANINAMINGQTPLFIAAQMGHTNTVETILLKNRDTQHIPLALNAHDLFDYGTRLGIHGDLINALIQFKKEAGFNRTSIPIFPVEIAGMLGRDDVVAIFEAFPSSEQPSNNEVNPDVAHASEVIQKAKDVVTSLRPSDYESTKSDLHNFSSLNSKK